MRSFSTTRSSWFDFATKKVRSEEHTSELQSHHDLVCRLLLEKKKKMKTNKKLHKNKNTTQTWPVIHQMRHRRLHSYNKIISRYCNYSDRIGRCDSSRITLIVR